MAKENFTSALMSCRVDGCCRKPRYAAERLCQTHYSRLWRTGSVELSPRHPRQARVVMPGKGYIRVYAPHHPLADSQGYVSEHRQVVFDRIGFGLSRCELCGAPVDWKTVHIDHIDRNVSNNAAENLRPLCRSCNVWRDYPDQHTLTGRTSISYGGETKTATEWARDPRVMVSAGAIKHRIKKGLSVEEALFGEKVTHNGKLPKPAQRKTQFKHQRKNAVAITIDGVTMTAAEWARETGVSVSEAGIIWRIRNNWEPRRAVFQNGRAMS